jgi:hypothetical protein
MPGPDLSAMITAAVTPRDLRPRDDLREPGWTFWELRTINVHRVVGLLQQYRQFTDARAFESAIRGAVARNFKCSWWRGMGLGIVAHGAAIPLSADDLKVLVDVRENSKGTLQWVILVSGDTHAAVGVHTWMETYLSPVYRRALQGLTEAGYRVSSVTRNKDGLMKFLTGVADLEAILLSLGTRKQAFPQFHDPRQT